LFYKQRERDTTQHETFSSAESHWFERADERALTNCQNIGRVAKHSRWRCCRR